MLTLNLSPEEEARLSAEARKKGVEPEECVRQLLRDHLPPIASGEATRALLRSWREEDETPDPTEVEAAQRELDEFKKGMNDERARAGARPLYP
jgi:hypothetical protein